MREYLFNKHAIRHQLCIDCGVDVFARGKKPDGSDVIALNVSCIDGIELCKRLRSDARTRAIPVLAVTGYGDRHYSDRARIAGADRVLIKPCDAEMLVPDEGWVPVEAPEGTAARPSEPSSSRTSTSTVGLPRESRISRAVMSTIAVIR